MLKKIRTSKTTKVIVCYLSLMTFLEATQPMRIYALTSGPSQPEFTSFTPISTSDMVDLSTGNFNYNIPIMDVGGYPLNLSYNSGITMDQEASWTGLGWNLNVGQIERQVRGLPDDFKGDEMRYENDIKDNITIGASFNVHPAFAGFDFPFNGGLGVQYNNYEGITFKPIIGVSFPLAENVNVGVNLTGSVGEGATISPSVSVSSIVSDTKLRSTSLTSDAGISFNSRQGLQNVSLSVISKTTDKETGEVLDDKTKEVSGSLSFNNQYYTPTKRVAYDNLNLTFNGSLGAEFYLAEANLQIEGYGSLQRINKAYKDRKVAAYGFENTEYKGENDDVLGGGEGVLDFNRENERTVSETTTALPVTNYTYDIYTIDGQGVSGMFRPYRSQVANVGNDKVNDFGIGLSAGAEFGAGGLIHGGINFLVSPSASSTGKWITKNDVLPLFTESTKNRKPLDQPVSFKMVGELDVDREPSSFFSDRIHGNHAMRLKLDKKRYENKTQASFEVKNGNALAPNHYDNADFTTKIKRTTRYLSNQVIQKVTNAEADSDPFINKADARIAKKHHTAGIKILKTDGSTYVYGQAVYNIKKVEATFDISSRSGAADLVRGTVNGVNGTKDHHSDYSDRFVNKITTPAYAYSYLISSILSPDYEDRLNDGPTMDDLGTYTKFEYQKKSDVDNVYKWRVPYSNTEVSYNEGLKSHHDDEKGNYLYGEKELTYLKRIITKTHVAIFKISQRKDARGAKAQLGTVGETTPAYTYQLDQISLYSRAEAENAHLLNDSIEDDVPCKPIKTANFVYTNALCNGMPNNMEGSGKLTLDRVYFTYGDSNMGKYTPYVFKYGGGDLNPSYAPKGYDVWGNYKPVSEGINANINSPLTNSEYPFVEQCRKAGDTITARQQADINSAAWVLKSVELPSGGEITINTESDDYKFVQNKRAMQMFKVIGAGDDETPSANTNLYTDIQASKYIYVDLGDEDDVDKQLNHATLTPQLFKDKYLFENWDKPIYFKFLLNMAGGPTQYDFVSGYFTIKKSEEIKFAVLDSRMCAIIPLKTVNREGGITPSAQANPISKSGWGFGRMYLNRVVYSDNGNSNNSNFVSIVHDLVGSIKSMSELWKGPNKVLQENGCAKHFIPGKSWIRLENPDGHKLGGGLRVKSIELSDNWDVMTSSEDDTANLYHQKYGQSFNYSLNDGTSSGVATFEPNMSPDNPFVEPFYGKTGDYEDRMTSPKDQNYVEKPFGATFFPCPKITYSKVTVSNLERRQGTNLLKRHATGRVVTQHYTTYDFPTIVDYTDINMAYDPRDEFLSFLNILSIDHLVATQGYSIETNDMDGKVRSEDVYGEEDAAPISGVKYNYNVGVYGKLDNSMTTIDGTGNISKKLIGVDYDMINDFNESKSQSGTLGYDANLAVILAAILPTFVPTVFPKVSYHETILRTAVTTKVIHRTGILVETIAFDNLVASAVTTKNLAWDAQTGQVILTETKNEFNDTYYNFNYPAYWYYNGMGLAAENLDASGVLLRANPSSVDGNVHYSSQGFKMEDASDIAKIFKLGDELILPIPEAPGGTYGPGDELGELPPEPPVSAGSSRAWVVGFNSTKTRVYLMNRFGLYVDPCGIYEEINFKIVRSGNRNQQQGMMESVTSMNNPIDANNDGTPDWDSLLNADLFAYAASGPSLEVLNANAVSYNDYWPGQEENTLPYPVPSTSTTANGDVIFPYTFGVNPYINNIKGDWRPDKSYAYLTQRTSEGENPRNMGFFKSYNPFYKRVSGGWAKNTSDVKWTNASTVTMFSPYGMELENKDALSRFSSAQYGYLNNLPMAVASNSEYREMGFDSFEEEYGNDHFGFWDPAGEIDHSIVSNQAHTGKRSIKVSAGNYVNSVKSLKPKNPPKPNMKVSCALGVDYTPDDSPGCLVPATNFSIFYVKTEFDDFYHVNVTPEFGHDGLGDISFYPDNHEWSLGSGTINYHGTTIPHGTIVTIIDGDTVGDPECSTFIIEVSVKTVGGVSGFYLSQHGCSGCTN